MVGRPDGPALCPRGREAPPGMFPHGITALRGGMTAPPQRQGDNNPSVPEESRQENLSSYGSARGAHGRRANHRHNRPG